jgi:hypothetical protein
MVLALTGGLAARKLLAHCPHAGSPELAEPPPADELRIEPSEDGDDRIAAACESPTIRNVVLRGQFIAHRPAADHFAIQLPGRSGSYSAITDARGYFERGLCRRPVQPRLVAQLQRRLDDAAVHRRLRVVSPPG